jgi:tRNA/tmRNA/rRNA uracil-C5-methylase (TrmA/RlmC/RlmD family)
MVPVTAQAPARPLPGDVLELTVGEPAHGGWCIARADGLPADPADPTDPADPAAPEGDGAVEPGRGLVLFIRHALPGERVRAVVTQVTAKLARADAVEILDASPDRVEPPCPHARPGACGGCDWQHASLPAQRRLKAQVIRQQLSRIAGLDRDVTVEPLPGDEPTAPAAPAAEPNAAAADPADPAADPGAPAAEPGAPSSAARAPGLGWRTRVTFAVGPGGTTGLRRHRSHEIIPVGECPIAHPLVNAAGVPGRPWRGAVSVEVAVVPATGERALLITGPPRGRVPAVPAGLPADSVRVTGRNGARTALSGRGHLTQHAAGRDWRADLAGFWQVHPAAADTLTAAVLAALDPRPGDAALDLYCGAGLFAGALAQAVGPSGRVTAVEGDVTAARDARHNLRDWPWTRVHRGDAAEVLSRIGLAGTTLAVLDPPRAGASREVIDALAHAPDLRRIAYVSCDPATLARDLSRLTAAGWSLTALRAFDAFPMTHHVECLATLTRDTPPPSEEPS